ncbi:hypothetical protein [Nannocystis punicea]|uniref:Uncharacterized protein n=1 Tax=Nannocystis punicea TaxID=2995304 RepID=A0ABY7GS60_9BACT|nr:hypothetical protein [Nannocystis poenicansa]WAS89804.1 hypothetical protein O0S08_26735 [Nannocystis poenicansa]
MARPRARRLVLTIVACLAVGAYFVYPYAVVAYLARSIAAATTAEAETAALCRANQWFHAGRTPTYSVATHDRDGAELRPWQDGSYDRVAKVTLTWMTGQSVERVLLTRDGLDCVFGE